MSKERFVVLSTMKNEGAFLLEWVAHHKALGFDQLVICTNDCEDTTTLMVKQLERLGLAKHHATQYKTGMSIQRRAFSQARLLPEIQEADWIWVCDADEFLSTRIGDGSIQALSTAGSPDVDVISVPWRLFGNNDVIEFSPEPVTVQFTKAVQPGGHRGNFDFAKSLFRGKLLKGMSRIGIHMPVAEDLPYKQELAGGGPVGPVPMKLKVPMDFSLAQVNHYALKSRDSFLIKSARGRVNHVNDKMGASYWFRYNANDVECDMIRRYDPAVKAWMDTLLSDQTLARLHRRSIRWHRLQVAALRARPDFAELVSEISARSSSMLQHQMT